jgi:hypothetical protein
MQAYVSSSSGYLLSLIELAVTDTADIQPVYNILLQGSNNHLNAFSRGQTNQTGETTIPQSLTAEQHRQPVPFSFSPTARTLARKSE